MLAAESIECLPPAAPEAKGSGDGASVLEFVMPAPPAEQMKLLATKEGGYDPGAVTAAVLPPFHRPRVGSYSDSQQPTYLGRGSVEESVARGQRGTRSLDEGARAPAKPAEEEPLENSARGLRGVQAKAPSGASGEDDPLAGVGPQSPTPTGELPPPGTLEAATMCYQAIREHGGKDLRLHDSELLLRAAETNRADQVHVLVHDYSCDINAAQPSTGSTALHVAVQAGSSDVVSVLLR